MTLDRKDRAITLHHALVRSAVFQSAEDRSFRVVKLEPLSCRSEAAASSILASDDEVIE